MPVKSKAQMKWMAINKPELLHKWQKEKKRNYKSLPVRVKKKKA